MPSLILFAIVFVLKKLTVYGSLDIYKWDPYENVPLIRLYKEFKEELSSVISKHNAGKESDKNKKETNKKEVLLPRQERIIINEMSIKVILHTFLKFELFIKEIFFTDICINNTDQSDENHKVANRIKEYRNQKIMNSNKYDRFFLGQYNTLMNDCKDFCSIKDLSNHEIFDDIDKIREKLKNLVLLIQSIKDSSNACI